MKGPGQLGRASGPDTRLVRTEFKINYTLHVTWDMTLLDCYYETKLVISLLSDYKRATEDQRRRSL